MTRTPISPYAKPTGAKRPGLQALRMQDPQAQKAFEALREWMEVLAGSRGDPYEKAVTLREFEKRLTEVFRVTGVLKDFDGTLGALRADPVAALPTDVRVGSFVTLDNGDLYFGSPLNVWKKVTLT